MGMLSRDAIKESIKECYHGMLSSFRDALMVRLQASESGGLPHSDQLVGCHILGGPVRRH